MTSKRLRIGGSSFDDAALSRQLINPNKYMKPSPEFFIAPPPPSFPAQQPIGFLDKCYYCNMRTHPGTKIFMYRDFCAFCSEECRAIQMAIDELEARQRIFKQEENQFRFKMM